MHAHAPLPHTSSHTPAFVRACMHVQDIVDCLEVEVLAQSDLKTRLEESQAQLEAVTVQRGHLQAQLDEAQALAAHLQVR